MSLFSTDGGYGYNQLMGYGGCGKLYYGGGGGEKEINHVDMAKKFTRSQLGKEKYDDLIMKIRAGYVGSGLSVGLYVAMFVGIAFLVYKANMKRS